MVGLCPKNDYLVDSSHLRNISQIGNLPQVGVKIKNLWNHLDDYSHHLTSSQTSILRTPPHQKNNTMQYISTMVDLITVQLHVKKKKESFIFQPSIFRGC